MRKLLCFLAFLSLAGCTYYLPSSSDEGPPGLRPPPVVAAPTTFAYSYPYPYYPYPYWGYPYWSYPWYGGVGGAFHFH
jgi:hypothetical protein